MQRHILTADIGREFEVVVADDGQIADVVGDWPTGSEFVLEGPVPAHARPIGLPAEVSARASTDGWEVCFYDGKRTCWCKDGKMRCSGIS